MESTLSTINLMPLGKEQIQDFANKTIEEVKAGNINALELKAKLKAIEQSIDLIDKGTKEEQSKEMGKYGKSAELLGFRIEQAELGVKYNYSECGDVEWLEIDKKLAELNESKRKREQMLKTLTKPVTVASDSTGEIYTIHPPIKTSTTGLKFTLK